MSIKEPIRNKSYISEDLLMSDYAWFCRIIGDFITFISSFCYGCLFLWGMLGVNFYGIVFFFLPFLFYRNALSSYSSAPYRITYSARTIVWNSLSKVLCVMEYVTKPYSRVGCYKTACKCDVSMSESQAEVCWKTLSLCCLWMCSLSPKCRENVEQLNSFAVCLFEFFFEVKMYLRAWWLLVTGW